MLPEALESALLSRLRMLPQAAYNTLPGASEGLGNSLYRAAHEEPTLDGVLAAAKSKRYALSRIRRMTMCAALGVTAGMDAGTPPYARVLAIGTQGRELLRAIDARTSVPVITKPAAGRSLPGQSHRAATAAPTAQSRQRLASEHAPNPWNRMLSAAPAAQAEKQSAGRPSVSPSPKGSRAP